MNTTSHCRAPLRPRTVTLLLLLLAAGQVLLAADVPGAADVAAGRR